MLGEAIDILLKYNIISFSAIILITFLVVIIFVYRQIKKLLLKDNNASLNTSKPLDVKTLNEELRPYGFAYTLDEDMFFSIMYPWQREYGYCQSYDDIAPLLSMIIDSEPIYFEYQNERWLIEFWKGQYGMTTGGEIGIYVNRSQNNESFNILDETFYDSITDEEMLHMSYVLKKKKKVLLTRNAIHWWLTGFKLGEFSKPSDLIMDIAITFNDEDMLESFLNGLRMTGYKNKDIKILNKTVAFTFDKPHTKQPITKTPLIKYIMQINNKQNCALYESITKDYNTTLDKLNYIREKFPIMYAEIMDFGKSKYVFQSYNRKIDK